MPKLNKETGKFTRIKIPIEMKKQIIEKRENGVSVIKLAREYNRTTSTICSILKDKEKLKALTVSKGVSRRSEKRSQVIDDVERLLLIWINEKQQQGGNITQCSICEKAKRIFNDIVEDLPSSSTSTEVFKASNGWFERFKKRTGIYNVIRHGEGAGGSNVKAANDFVKIFNDLVHTGGYLPQQIFSCNETGLFWKKISNIACLTAEQKHPQHPKSMKDRLTLLLCANASGDLKIKPLLVDQSDNSKPFKSNKVQNLPLNVMWRSRKKALITRDTFVDWIRHTFCPSVKTYLLENNLPLHALLVMDNAPCHPQNLQDLLPEEFKFIRVQFLPCTATPLLQPIDHQVKSNFKKLYMKELFQHCFDATEGTSLSLEEFWKHHFHVVTCIKIIGKAWNGVTARTLNAGWKKLWTDVECSESAHISTSREPTVDELVSLASCLGLDIENKDIEDLLAEHLEDPSTEELKELQKAEGQEIASEVVEKRSPPSTEDILQVLQAWDTVSSYVIQHHPDEAVALQLNDAYEANAISHFRCILQQRQNLFTNPKS
ncbi:tigger transposable element-derived protein 1-like [Anopheles funestus]|uniref:tigger transposable element-derived protein 1-like n=1 Tax=Anopheles funestus TaxID=62324 RepID=UPI0020C72B90|nr:tigger transposable element-derived protein 1-like [Anopheles funestus]